MFQTKVVEKIKTHFVVLNDISRKLLHRTSFIH